jgi:hypothetical protein
MNLELETIAFAGLNPLQRFFPTSWQSPECVMLLGVKGINANPNTHDSNINEVFRLLVVDQHTVGPKHNHEPEVNRMAGNHKNVWTNQRLTARDNQETPAINLRDLVDEHKTFLSRQFIFPSASLRRRIKVTMVTSKIASLGKIKGNEVRLEVIHRSPVMRCKGVWSQRLQTSHIPCLGLVTTEKGGKKI